MDKLWEVAERKYHNLLDQILFNRSIEKGDREEFLNPDFEILLNNDEKIKDQEIFVEKIIEAKRNGIKIGIFADYDADGIPGAALLYRTLTKIGITAYFYIPGRDEGYGLNKKGIDYLIGKECKIVITVDLGIKNIDEAKYCRNKNIDLIITDHHLSGEKIPEAAGVINPKLRVNKNVTEYCGCGVVYKLITGLSNKFPEIDEKFIKWNLDLAAISTISDMVPLVKNNRVMAKYGLVVISKTKNLGLKELLAAAGIDPGKINTYTVGFQIGPRINTPGRIDHGVRSLELLITEDKMEAKELAVWLNEKNIERQEQMDKVYAEAENIIEKNEYQKNNIIILAGDWPKGIIGPPASKLVEKYSRPVIIFSESKKEYSGSARSVVGVNIISLLDKASDLLLKYGGHSGAAGLSVTKNNYEIFSKRLTEISAKEINPEQLIKKLKIDAEINIEDLNRKLYKTLEQLEPFGLGNPRPVFLLSAVTFNQLRLVGGTKKHLSSYIGKKSQRIKTIFFNFDNISYFDSSGELYDIVFSIDEDNWNGREDISLNIIDIRKHEEK
ncbi:MAG: single-stranded-DNA-specific exonuclease RecJ [Patescibacteria group bacterium]